MSTPVVDPQAPRLLRRRAWRIVAIYVVFATCWIYFSDHALRWSLSDPELLTKWSVYKGVAFVAVTAALLLFLLRQMFTSIEAGYISVARQQSVAQNEKRFSEAMIDTMPGILYLYDDQYRFLRWNRNFERVSGYSAEEIARMSPLDFFLPKEKTAVQSRITEVFAQGSAFIEAAFVSKNGTTAPYFFTGHRVTFEGRNCLVGVGLDMTDRKQTERALQESEERFNAFMDATPAITWVTDEAGRHVYMNPAWDRAFGLNRKEWMGKTAFDLVPPAAAELIRRSDAEVLSRDQALEIPEDTGELLGRRFYWNCIKFPFRNSAGQRFLGGIAIDITERKRTELALQASQERYRRTLDNILEGCQLIGFDWRYLYLNAAAAIQNRRPNEELLGRTMTEAWPGIEATHVYGLLRRCMEERIALHEEIDFAFPDGSKAWFDVRSQPVPEGIFVLSIDITERKRAEDNRRESEERFRATFEQAAVGIAHVGLDGRFQRVNDRLCAITGYPREELLRLTFFELTVPEERAEGDRARLAMLERQQTSYTTEKRYQQKGGKIIWVSVVTNLFRDPQGEPRYFIAVTTDITERKTLEEQFLRAQRMESIGTLASGIAHDLNNVLAPILMSIALLKLKVPDKPDMQRQLDQLATNTERGANLVRHLLAFGRGFVGERIPIQPRHIAKEIAQLVEDTFPKSIQLDFTFEPALWNIVGDPTQLHQILLNLCVNARDAMPQGGRLTLQLGNAQAPGKNPGLQPEMPPGPYVVLTVSDTGTGIPLAIREKIFDPFFTTKDPGKGTGLGLSTTLAIVRSHGGFLDLESTEGKGTTFRVYLPANSDDVAVAVAADPARLEGLNELILVVDDEELIRDATRRILEKFGYRVLLAVNGVDAVSQYALQHDKIAAVMTDMAMPVMGGPATILALRSINPKVRILASSGHMADTVRAEAEAAGVNISNFISKPYTAEQLLAAVRKVIGEDSHAPFSNGPGDSRST